MSEGMMGARGRVPDDDGQERESGARLVTRLLGMLRSARLYEESNQAYLQQRDELLASLAGTEGDETTLVVMGESVYVNGLRLRGDASRIALFRALQEEFEGRALGALRFLPGLRGDELSAFVRMFVAARTPELGEHLPVAMTEAGILNVIAVRARDMGSERDTESDEPAAKGERGRAREMFQRAVQGTRSVLMRTERTGRPPLRQARHLVQPMVDSIMKNEFSLVGLAAIKEYDEYTYAHCVNVSVLSIAMGQVLGLDRATLANLGVAALLHDLGKLEVPLEVLHKPGKLTPEEWSLIQRHPLEGVKLVSRLPGLTTLTLDVMRIAFEHHMHVDGGGYPRLATRRPMLALSRIVAVSDCYDAMTAHRAYRSRPFTGREALEHIMGPEGAHHDPAALWALVRSVGLFPAGSVMVTASGHELLSLTPNPADPYRPHCRVLRHPDGRIPDPETPELWEPMPAGHHVTRVMLPEEYPVPTELLLAA